MHDLRRQALESGKTVSRKARSRQSSAATSRSNSKSRPGTANSATSRGNSRPGSRAGSDDEGSLSDETNFSVNSIDDIIAEEQEPGSSWNDDLAGVIESLVDRNWKRSNHETRERDMTSYIRALTAHVAKEEVLMRESELIEAFVKSLEADDTETESLLALKAIALTIITTQNESTYEQAAPAVKNAVSDSVFLSIKAASIHTLAMLSFYSSISDEETIDVMAFFLEIISSDGAFVDADDDAATVTAALEAYGLLATLVDDLEAESDAAVEAFIDQLQSRYADVQVAAGENIALLFEKSYTPPEDGEHHSDHELDSDEVIFKPNSSTPMLIKRYSAYHRPDQLAQQLHALAHASSHAVSKKDRKHLHATFGDVLGSVSNPSRGPRYRSAIDDQTGKEYGSRMKVKVGRDGGVMVIDKWWKLQRLKALRKMLRGGFLVHYEKNEAIFESLPVVVFEDQGKANRSPKALKRRFAGKKFLDVDYEEADAI